MIYLNMKNLKRELQENIFEHIISLEKIYIDRKIPSKDKIKKKLMIHL